MNDNDQVVSNAELNRLAFWMALIAVAMSALSAYAWVQLPDGIRIPVHWGIDGQPDRFGGKVEGLLLMPGVALLIAGLLRVIPMIEPRRINLLRSFAAYRVMGLAVAGFLALLHGASLAKLLGLIEPDVTYWLGFLVGALFMAFGNYLGKVRSNFLFGIRTPWTLSSDLAWDKTHRLGGKLYFISGLLGVMLTAVVPSYSTQIFLVLVIGSTLTAVIYSWFVWRSAPDRRSA